MPTSPKSVQAVEAGKSGVSDPAEDLAKYLMEMRELLSVKQTDLAALQSSHAETGKKVRAKQKEIAEFKDSMLKHVTGTVGSLL